VWKRIDTLDGQTFTTTYDYADGRDNLTSITYPSGRVVTYTYDVLDRMTRVFDPASGATYADQFEHHPSGALEKLRAGTITTTQVYDPNRYWVTSINSSPLDLTYSQYDAVGNVKQITDGRSGYNQSFEYGDHLHRLTMATGPYGTKSYSYDAHGNPLTGFTYGDNPFRPTKVDEQDLLYDPAGRLTTGPNATYAYTPDHQLETATVAGTISTFAYDGDGWRIKKVVGGATSYYMRGVGGELLAERTTAGGTTTWRDYIYAGGRQLAVVTTTNVPALPTTCVFTEPILAGSTIVKAAMLTEIRSCTNDLRVQRGLSTVSWTNTSPAGVVIRDVHVEEVRTAINEVYTAAGLGTPVYTDPDLVPQTTVIKALHLTELRAALGALGPAAAGPQVRYYHLDAIGSVRALTLKSPR
jgi:YD repeat-containing protein